MYTPKLLLVPPEAEAVTWVRRGEADGVVDGDGIAIPAGVAHRQEAQLGVVCAHHGAGIGRGAARIGDRGEQLARSFDVHVRLHRHRLGVGARRHPHQVAAGGAVVGDARQRRADARYSPRRSWQRRSRGHSAGHSSCRPARPASRR